MTENIGAYMQQVATHYWGEPTAKRGHELRWGTHGSKSVDVKKGTWYDFETNEGGGVIDLVKREEGATLVATRYRTCVVGLIQSHRALHLPRV